MPHLGARPNTEFRTPSENPELHQLTGHNRVGAPGFARRGMVDRSKPFNIASYSLLTLMVAQMTGFEPGEFVHTLGDAHLYLNHLGQADTQLRRKPHPLPRMELNASVGSIFDFAYEDFALIGYQHHPAIRAPIAV